LIETSFSIADRVLGEEFLEFAVELRGKGLVVGHHQRRPIERLDDVRHGEGLARAGDPEERLLPLPLAEAANQLLDGRRLVAAGGHVSDEFELIDHGPWRGRSCASVTVWLTPLF